MEIEQLTKILNSLNNLKENSISNNFNDHDWNYMGIKIVVLQRGWISVGNLYKKNEYFKLTNCNTIRRWGTTKGLGEIAKNGPTSETKLDSDTETLFHELTVVKILDCNKEKWTKYV